MDTDDVNASASLDDAGVISDEHDGDGFEANASPIAQDGDVSDDLEEEERELGAMASNMCANNSNLLRVLYLSLFSAFGVTFRVFLGRFFGGDCSSDSRGQPVDDWMWPISRNVCITTDGTTEQYGGALFIDLPSNVAGSFLMGFMTGHVADLPAIPCLHHGHPLQGEDGFHLGVKTALCGSLTTFSSWNSQMVLMMDGTANPYLGSQVGAAIFGYVIGLQAAVSSYRGGRTVAAWTHRRKNPHVFDSELSKHDFQKKWHHDHVSWTTPVIVFIAWGLLVTLYVMGDLYWGVPYYRILWIGCLTAPVGTILRWKLSTMNGRFGYPTGTFLANLIASILSSSLSAWAYIESSDKGAARWEIPTVKAVSYGLVGSLSTVSTFVKECVDMVEKNPAFSQKSFLYSHGSMVICCLFGLLFYSPLVRYVE